MKCWKKCISVMLFLGAILCGCKSNRGNFILVSKLTPGQENGGTWQTVGQESGETLLKEKVENGQILIDGELYNALYGETGALIWKYVEETFSNRAYYKIAFIDDNMRIKGWKEIDGYETLLVSHVGGDNFYIDGGIGRYSGKREDIYYNVHEDIMY